MGDRHAGGGVEDVAVAAAVDIEIPLVVAAGGQRAVGEVDAGNGGVILARMADAHAPGPAIVLRAQRAHVAAEIDERMTHAVFVQDRGGAIGGVLLADAAEVDLHAGARQANRVLVPRDGGPVDQPPEAVECMPIRQLRWLRPEIPRLPQHAGGEVEAAFAQPMAGIRIPKQRHGFRVDGDGGATRVAIDACGQAVVTIARVFQFDAPHIRDRGIGGALRRRRIRARNLDFVHGGHRAKRGAEEGDGHRADYRAVKEVAIPGSDPG